MRALWIFPAVLTLWGCELIVDAESVPPPVEERDASVDPGPDAGACVPQSCAALGRTCGSAPDTCGGTLFCGTCPVNQQCSGAGACVPVCTPETNLDLCLKVSAVCGTITATDRCGSSRSFPCGTCPAGLECGVLAPNTCACTTTSCPSGTFCEGGKCVAGCAKPADCANGGLCENGKCVCAAGDHECSGKCVPNDSVTACGATCQVCPTDPNGAPACDGTACSLTCKAGTLLCAGACATCPAGSDFACQGAACVAKSCPTGTTPCATGCCGWKSEAANTSASGGRLSLALDGQGNPVIAFNATNAKEIKVVWRKPGAASWTVETVETVSTLVGDQRVAAGVGANGEPVVVYVDGKGNVRLGEHKVGGGWTKSSITTGVSPKSPSLVVDAAGALHVAWTEIESDTAPIRYASRAATGTTWSQATLVNPPATAVYTAIALEPSGKPAVAAVAYSVGPAGEDDVLLFRQPSAAWVFDRVDRGTFGSSLGLGFDATGAPRLGFFNYDTDAARYAVKGASWQQSDLTGTVLEPVAFAAHAGNPHFVFADQDDELRHAFLKLGSWTSEAVGQQSKGGLALALDANGLPRVAFRDTNDTIRYAAFGP